VGAERLKLGRGLALWVVDMISQRLYIRGGLNVRLFGDPRKRFSNHMSWIHPSTEDLRRNRGNLFALPLR